MKAFAQPTASARGEMKGPAGVERQARRSRACRRTSLIATWSVACLFLAQGGRVVAAADVAGGRPNILLITAEDHGSQLSCYGDPNIKTPNLDRLAAGGMRFSNAYATFSVCSPSRASLLTGLYPHQHGQIGLATHGYAMFPDIPNLPALLKQAGYRTGIIGKLHVNPEAAFPFDFRALPTGNFGHRFMREFAAEAKGFINASPDPFFLYLNYPEAHFPVLKQQDGLPEKPITASDLKSGLSYIGVDTPRIRKQIANYYNCLLRLDAGIGMVLDELEARGCATNTLIIYLADHGPQFSRAKTTVYEAGIKVPLLLRWPARVQPRQVRDELVNEIDILPTVLEASGLPPRTGLPGRSLMALNGATSVKGWRHHSFAWQTGGATAFWTFPQISVRDERYKLILNLTPGRENPCATAYATHFNAFFVAGTEPAELASAPKEVQDAYRTWQHPPAVELYDLLTDPDEFRNRAGDEELAPVRTNLLGVLKEWRTKLGEPFVESARLSTYLREADEVNQKRAEPRNSDQQGQRHQWKYLEYLNPERP